MKVSTKGDYGIRALIELAHHYCEVCDHKADWHLLNESLNIYHCSGFTKTGYCSCVTFAASDSQEPREWRVERLGLVHTLRRFLRNCYCPSCCHAYDRRVEKRLIKWARQTSNRRQEGYSYWEDEYGSLYAVRLYHEADDHDPLDDDYWLSKVWPSIEGVVTGVCGSLSDTERANIRLADYNYDRLGERGDWQVEWLINNRDHFRDVTQQDDVLMTCTAPCCNKAEGQA